MSLVKVMVTGGCTHPTLLPWKIMSVHDPEETFSSLFQTRIKPRILEKLSDLEHIYSLEKCFVGECKDSLDESDVSLAVGEVTSAFGQYIKFFVIIRCEEVACNPTRNPTRNAADVLMQTSMASSCLAVPTRVSARNRKDDLYNAIVDLFEEKNLVLPQGDANMSGKHLVRALCNVLWYIDGQHETLSARNCRIPEIFLTF